jgi:hypothetical protein
MRRTIAFAVAFLAVFAGVAVAQTSVPITVKVFPKVTPNQAGTAAHPQGVHLSVKITIGIPVNDEPPLVKEIDVWFPRGSLFQGGKFPTCSARRMNVGGPAACPKQSIMGSGGGVARADQTLSFPKITVVNGGQHVVYFYTVLNNPARVQEPVAGNVTKLSGIWAYKLHVRIPRNLQIVAGVPLVLKSLHIAAGRGSWLSTTSCPASHKWNWKALALFNNGQQIATNGSVGCRS